MRVQVPLTPKRPIIKIEAYLNKSSIQHQTWQPTRSFEHLKQSIRSSMYSKLRIDKSSQTRYSLLGLTPFPLHLFHRCVSRTRKSKIFLSFQSIMIRIFQMFRGRLYPEIINELSYRNRRLFLKVTAQQQILEQEQHSRNT